jgi:hypothetical protein
VTTYDPHRALRVLQEHDVRFVVIGGLAGRLWGSPTMTNDVDIFYDRDRPNLEHLAAALTELGARLRGVDQDAPFILDAETLGAGSNFTFTTDAGPLDVLGWPAGAGDFGSVSSNAVPFDLGDGVVVPVADLDDLIRMKEAAGRPKDRVEVEILGAVRDEIRRSPPPRH